MYKVTWNYLWLYIGAAEKADSLPWELLRTDK